MKNKPGCILLPKLHSRFSNVFIDIHTHLIPREGTAGIQNLLTPELPEPATGLYSMGIHPWYATALHWENQWEKLKLFSLHPKVVAIGETGLDTVCDTPFPLQLKVFTEQVKWANSIGKPLVIHCVKAWDPLLALLKKENPAVPVIIHGFRKNRQLAQQLINAGCYISLGKAIELNNVQELLQVIPAGRLFFETDDSSVFIGDIYNTAAKASGIELNSLVLQIQQNAQQVFGPAFTI